MSRILTGCTRAMLSQAAGKELLNEAAGAAVLERRSSLLHLIQVEQVSYPTFRQNVCALKFLYRVTLGRAWEVDRIPFPKHRRPASPRVLNREQVLALFAGLKSPKYRVLLLTCYAAGLRIGEACRLRIEDIDSSRKVICVRCGKVSLGA